MIVDGILILVAIGAVISGYRRGFLQSFFSTVGYIGGGVLGLSLGLSFAPKVHLNKFLVLFIAIFLFAEIGRRILGLFAAFFRARLLWTPLRFIDSIAGITLELVRVIIFTYLLIALALLSPWTFARHSISESKIYPEMKKHIPHVLDQLRVDIEKELQKKFGAIPRS